MRHRTVALRCLLVCSALACTDAPTRPPEAAGPTVQTATAERAGPTDRHIVALAPGRGSAAARATVAALGGSVVRTHEAIGVLVTRGLTDAAARTLAAAPDVMAVTRAVRQRMIPPTDQPAGMPRRLVRRQTDQRGAFFFPQFQWNMRVIDADDAWLVTNQGAGALVCILDSGIDPTHLDLAGRVELGLSRSFVPSEPDIFDRNTHGTFVSAIVTSNGIAVASVAPDARLCALKVLDRTGSGSFDGVIAAILYAADVGADVANMSLGAYVPRQDPGIRALRIALERAAVYAWQRGTLLVASAGNSSVNLNDDGQNAHFPSEINHVVSVGATGPVNQQDFDRLASYSNYGKRGVDLFAPGGDFVPGTVLQDLIVSACSSFIEPCSSSNDWYVFGAGTSASAPHVTGAAAVVESELPGDQNAARLSHCLLVSADPIAGPGRDPVFGKGRLNVLGAAECRRLE